MREPSLEIIYGDETETVHKENGCLFNLDLSKVMWAKGNNNERLRIAKLVEDGEVVVDMFAGIGYSTIFYAGMLSLIKSIKKQVMTDWFQF